VSVLKDVECTRCKRVYEAMVDGDTRQYVEQCELCGRVSVHRTICTGGCKTRWRWNDHTYDSIRERFHVRGAEAYNVDDNGNEVPATDFNNGSDISQTVNAMNAAARDERKDQIHYHVEKRRGRAPIRIDMKRNAHAGG
jgi:hypothetical protein